MSVSSQLESLKQQLQENNKAFKKNKQNFSLQSNYAKPLKSNADLKQINKSVKSSLASLLNTKKSSTQAYECAIKHLKLLLQQAWTKNQFLVKDRAQILRENFALKQNVEQLTKALEEAKQCIQEMKLNGYSGNCVNGMYEDGCIFRVGTQIGSRLVEEMENYSIEQRPDKERGYTNDSKEIGHNSHILEQQSSPSPCSQQSHQQSLLLRQVSAQHFLPSPSLNNRQLSPALESQPSSQINQTPNYNFKLDLDNINPVKNHYVDVGSKFISYNNSCQGSGCDWEQEKERGRNEEVEISMNNLISHNQLYLPLDKDGNRKYLKQEIETFKECLHNVNNSEQKDSFSQGNGNHNEQEQRMKQSQQYLIQMRDSNSFPCSKQTLSPSQPTSFIYCSSSCQQGIFRAFYLSIIRYSSYRQKFYQNLRQLQHDDSFLLFNLYPKNGFWIEMICHFLQWIELEKPSHEEVLRHLNTHKLIDMLLIQALKYRVQWMFSDCVGMLDESAVMNGSINNNHNINNNITLNQHPSLPTNRQTSVNCSFQQPLQPPSQFLQFFTGLCNDFGLQCKKEDKAFYFYQTQQSPSNHNLSQSAQPRHLFIIVNMQQMNAFGFEFSLQFQKQSSNANSRIDYMTGSQEYIRKSQQLHQYSNSVKRNFKNIEIIDPLSEQQKSSQNSNLLNSYSNSQERYYEERQFVSQTHQYDEENNQQEEGLEEGDRYQEESSRGIDINKLSYNTTMRQNKFNSTTRNVTQLLNNSHSNESSLKSNSLRASLNQGSYQLKSQRGRQLRQRPINYNTLSHNCPIPEDLAQNQSRQQLYSSFGKSNPQNLSKLSSLAVSPDVSSKNFSKVFNQKKENYTPAYLGKTIGQKKENNRYARGNIFDENFIINQVKTIQSESSGSVVHSDSYLEDDDLADFQIKKVILR